MDNISFFGFELKEPTEEEFFDAMGFTYTDMYESIDELHKIIPPGDIRWDAISKAMETLRKGFI